MAIPPIPLPKGTIIRIGENPQIMRKAHGMLVKLKYDLNYPKDDYIEGAGVLENPNGFTRKDVNHYIQPTDELVSIPGRELDNKTVLSVLKKD